MVLMMVQCMTCKKHSEIDAKHPQYQKLKRGESKFFVCSSCNQNIQGQASAETNINVNDLDQHDAILRRK